MKNNNTKKKSLIAIVFYILSAIMAVGLIITIYKSHTYVASLVEQGLVISDQLFNVVTYYMEAVAPYLFYTIITFGVGYIISKVDNKTQETIDVVEVVEDIQEVSEEEEIAELNESVEIVNEEPANEEKETE